MRVSLIHSVSCSAWLNAYLELETKEWVAQSSASLRIFSYGNQISLFSISTGLSKHKRTHTYTWIVTSTTEQHKQKAHFDKSHQSKHWLYSPHAVAAFYTHLNSFFPSSSPTCPIVSEALCEAYCGQIESSSYRKKRRRRGNEGSRERKTIWTWRKVS